MLAVGSGKVMDDGKVRPCDVKKGDIVAVLAGNPLLAESMTDVLRIVPLQ